jgi:hypothetical protein
MVRPTFVLALRFSKCLLQSLLTITDEAVARLTCMDFLFSLLEASDRLDSLEAILNSFRQAVEVIPPQHAGLAAVKLVHTALTLVSRLLTQESLSHAPWCLHTHLFTRLAAVAAAGQDPHLKVLRDPTQWLRYRAALAVAPARMPPLEMWRRPEALQADGEIFAVLRRHTGFVNSVACSPDGEAVVSASDDGTLVLWKVATGAPMFSLEGHTDSVLAVAFSPTGDRIVSGSRDKTLAIWDCATGQRLHTLVGHKNWVLGVAFSADGLWVVSGTTPAYIL